MTHEYKEEDKAVIAEKIKQAIEENVPIEGSEFEEKNFARAIELAHKEADIRKPSLDITLEKAAKTRAGMGMFSQLTIEEQQRKRNQDNDRWWSK